MLHTYINIFFYKIISPLQKKDKGFAPHFIIIKVNSTSHKQPVTKQESSSQINSYLKQVNIYNYLWSRTLSRTWILHSSYCSLKMLCFSVMEYNPSQGQEGGGDIGQILYPCDLERSLGFIIFMINCLTFFMVYTFFLGKFVSLLRTDVRKMILGALDKENQRIAMVINSIG